MSSQESLFAAIEAGDINRASCLIESGVDINSHDATGMTPLSAAAYRLVFIGNASLVKQCIDKGADVNDKQHSQGYTPLMFAALAGKPDICKLLMDHGARSYSTNSIGKTASELAAFVGQHECVSVINNHVSIDQIEKFLCPQSATAPDEIHPVAIAFELSNYEEAMKYQKKKLRYALGLTHHLRRKVDKLITNPMFQILYVIDRVFEKQLRCKEGNEVMSLKVWVVLFIMRELYKFIGELVSSGKTSHDACLMYAKFLLKWEPGEQVRKNLETLLRNAVAAFPYHHSLLYETLVKAMSKTAYGDRPTAFEYIVQGLFGHRLLMASKFCATCGACTAKKRCPKCKLCYCSVSCQKFDWSIHKQCCESIKTWNVSASVKDTISLDDIKAHIDEIDA
ncbi:MYND finger [Dictyocaulus viviparus]|uniref:MYND finger n=1 Tax=Dictyocaulus viviparus TaxID=29172 RepID=A0A0D8YD86_DICVI|nr:MYND finger [Dictyocaulus viviparus]